MAIIRKIKQNVSIFTQKKGKISYIICDTNVNTDNNRLM